MTELVRAAGVEASPWERWLVSIKAVAVTSWPEWLVLASEIDAWFPGTEFDEVLERTWYRELFSFDADGIRSAVRAVVAAQPSDFAPSVLRVRARLEGDPGRPTFDEAFALLFDRGGLLSGPDNERYALFAAKKAHPLLAAFIASQGYKRLRMLQAFDPDEGHWRVKDLREAWEALEARADEREAAGLGLGEVRPRQVGPSRFDPARLLSAGGGPGAAGM
jgi:hypothetical protein